jgi:hypothetical protein
MTRWRELAEKRRHVQGLALPSSKNIPMDRWWTSK